MGNGAPHFIEGFIQRHGLGDKKVDIVTDPSLKVYQASQMKHSFWGTWGISGGIHFLKAWGKGHKQDSIEGSTSQQGGVLLVNSEGEIAYYFQSQFLGDHPQMADMTQAAFLIYRKLHPEGQWV